MIKDESVFLNAKGSKAGTDDIVIGGLVVPYCDPICVIKKAK